MHTSKHLSTHSTVIFPGFGPRMGVRDLHGGRVSSPTISSPPPSCFVAFEPWLRLISVPKTPVAILLPAHFERAVSTFSVGVIYVYRSTANGTISRLGTRCCQLQPQGGVLLSQGESFQSLGREFSHTRKGAEKSLLYWTNFTIVIVHVETMLRSLGKAHRYGGLRILADHLVHPLDVGRDASVQARIASLGAATTPADDTVQHPATVLEADQWAAGVSL